MAINKLFEKEDQTDGLYWVLSAVGIQGESVFTSIDLYKNQSAFEAGAKRMLTKHYPIPAVDLSASTLGTLYADIYAWLVANHPDFNGGSLV